MIADVWVMIALEFRDVQFDQWAVMPNHLPALLTLPPSSEVAAEPELGTVVQAFKRLTKNRYVTGATRIMDGQGVMADVAAGLPRSHHP
jgi:REP element-mobilizing transposase RayT